MPYSNPLEQAIVRNIPHMGLVTERLLTDLPRLLLNTGLEGLLLALVSRRYLDRLRSWSCRKDRYRYWNWDCGQNRY